MLKGTFFRITKLIENKVEEPVGLSSSSYSISITLDVEHPIYKGHFPDNPVVPGVCQLRMITEIVSEIKGKKMKLLEADNIKFLSMINPNEHPELKVDCKLKETDLGKTKATASISDDNKIFFKINSLFE